MMLADALKRLALLVLTTFVTTSGLVLASQFENANASTRAVAGLPLPAASLGASLPGANPTDTSCVSAGGAPLAFAPISACKTSAVDSARFEPAFAGFPSLTSSTTAAICGFVVGAMTCNAAGTFAPTQIPNLEAWYDASNPANLKQVAGAVSQWTDLTGNNNTLAQTAKTLQPSFVATGIDKIGSVSFNGTAYLLGLNGSFSSKVMNHSTVFIVSNETAGAPLGSLAFSGSSTGNPAWNIGLAASGATNFTFDNNGAGSMAPTVGTVGPAIWTAGGSGVGAAQFFRKNGNTLSTSTGPGSTVETLSFPFSVGAMVAAGHVSNGFHGQLGELLVFNRLLTSAESQQVEGYLACKWGLQNRLPANHPYRTTCPQGGSPAAVPTPPPAGSALQDPVQLRSANGQLTVNVVASQNAGGSPQLSYNGQSIPPTLRLLPGDTLSVNLTNSLPTPASGAGYFNDTNLHFHGLHVSPNAPGDDSIDMLASPGQSLHYKIVIPTNHPPGLYWYHTHAHGEAERQNLSGMSGALIVDGIARYAPQVANMAERIIIVRDALLAGAALPAADAKQVAAMNWAMQHGSGRTSMLGSRMSGMMSMSTVVRGASTAQTRNPYVVVNPQFRRFARPLATSTHCTGAETATKRWTVNGQTLPSIGIRPGEQQFWRLVNAGSDNYLDVQVDNTQMKLLALDGVPLASVGNAQPTVTHYVVPPASRIEFTVTGPAAGTTAYLRTNCFDAGSLGPAMPAATLATINSTSSITDNVRSRDRIAPAVKLRASNLHTAAYIKAQVLTGPTQTLVYDDQFAINGQTYNPAGPPSFYAQSGTTALWTIVNNSGQVHTFHIHQIHFLVQSVVGGSPADQSNIGQVLDNVNVPAATANGPGSVTLKMDFTDPTIVGTFLLHCHILSHEDAGMMAEVRVGLSPPLGISSAQVSFTSPTAVSQAVTVSGGKAPFSVSGCTKVVNATVSGATVTIKPAGAGSCSLTIVDASGLLVSVPVTVLPPPLPLLVAPNVLSFSSPTSGAQNASISKGVTPYSVAGCGGIATASINGNGLSATPHAAGSCTLVVSDAIGESVNVSLQVNSAPTGSPLDSLTFHQNNARQGWYQHETILNPTTVKPGRFVKLGSLQAPSGVPAMGKVYSQPLYVTNETVANGSTHNLVLIATANDQVYAFDDKTYALVWERNFTSPPSIVPQSYLDGGCEDVNPSVGITGTPVVDRTLDRMFVAVPTKESGAFHLRLHAISLKNGADALAPVEVSGSVALPSGGVASTSAQHNFNRGALLEANGNIYVALGSHCDFANSTTHGWVLGYVASTLRPSGNIINTTDGQAGTYLGSPWMSGFGPAADSFGNLYFATGNGLFDGISSFAMSDLKVPGNLDLSKGSFFSPAGELVDSNADGDLGSGGVMLFPDGLSSTFPHLLLQGGKCGLASTNGGTNGCQKYILNRDKMGGKTAGDTGPVWHSPVAGAMFGGPAYFESGSTSYVVYGGGTPLYTFRLDLSPVSLVVAAQANVGCLECRDGGSQPVVSSNGTQAGSAVAWAIKTPQGGSGGSLTLYAFNATTMQVLFSGVAGPWTIGSGASYIGGALVSPLVANGRVWVPTDGSVAVFGLTGVTYTSAPGSFVPPASVLPREFLPDGFRSREAQ